MYRIIFIAYLKMDISEKSKVRWNVEIPWRNISKKMETNKIDNLNCHLVE